MKRRLLVIDWIEIARSELNPPLPLMRIVKIAQDPQESLYLRAAAIREIRHRAAGFSKWQLSIVEKSVLTVTGSNILEFEIAALRQVTQFTHALLESELPDTDEDDDIRVCPDCGGDLRFGRHQVRVHVDYYMCEPDPFYEVDHQED